MPGVLEGEGVVEFDCLDGLENVVRGVAAVRDILVKLIQQLLLILIITFIIITNIMRSLAVCVTERLKLPTDDVVLLMVVPEVLTVLTVLLLLQGVPVHRLVLLARADPVIAQHPHIEPTAGRLENIPCCCFVVVVVVIFPVRDLSSINHQNYLSVQLGAITLDDVS